MISTDNLTTFHKTYDQEDTYKLGYSNIVFHSFQPNDLLLPYYADFIVYNKEEQNGLRLPSIKKEHDNNTKVL